MNTYKVSLTTLLTRCGLDCQSSKGTGKKINEKIISISVVNAIAIAEPMVKMYDFIYHEFLSFHKLDRSW
jgi:hypothetical protein